MKKLLFPLALITLIAGMIITGCQTSTQKEEAAEVKLQEAKQDLKEVQNEANKPATTEEWKTFKHESEIKINDNNLRIAELKIKKNKSGKVLDGLYANKIENLEQKNNLLKIRMEAYEKNQSDWESFKREFNHDMDELGQALKDLTVDNKK